MLNSVLLHLEDDERSQIAIAGGLELARRHEARVRGLSILDTRRARALQACEAAAHAAFECDRVARAEVQLAAVRNELATASALQSVRCEVRHEDGEPLKVFRREARYHDLVVTACPSRDGDLWRFNHDRAEQDVMRLLSHGVTPLLVLREAGRALSRVLLVCDGTPVSVRAIRSYLGQQPCPEAESRLLAIGKDRSQGEELLREMSEYCRAHGVDPETGFACGSLRTVLVPYAKKWQADLVVMGAERGGRLLAGLFGQNALRILRQTSCALYVAE